MAYDSAAALLHGFGAMAPIIFTSTHWLAWRDL